MIGVLKVLSVLGIVCSSAIVTNNYHHKDINDRVVIANEATLDDYATIDFEDDINGGVKILCKQDTDANDFATMTMTLPETIDISGAHALTMRIKSISGNYPFFFHLIDENGNSVQLPGNSSGKKIKYVSRATDETAATSKNCLVGGNDHTIKYRVDSNGTLVFPLANFEALSGTIDYSKIKKIEISVAVYYDYGFACCFGDLGIIKSDASWELKYDCSKYNFSDVYAVTAFSDYMMISKVNNSGVCPVIGDVKVLNVLSFENDDEVHTAVTWNSGDNLCSYWKEEDAVRIHIGPYETGHTYGSYMCVKLSNTDAVDDYNFYRKVDGEIQYAKGLTMYLKNCSRKDIGINLQFDEFSTVDGASCYERWIMKGYPAMYYAWDINTDAEYVFYSKSDQFQIPVGFEGYVRIPFDQLQVPDWNLDTKGVDQILDLSKFNKEFYLTSDNTRYEDLEFLIKNVGVYFNETYKATLFDSEHGIKANMGL